MVQFEQFVKNVIWILLTSCMVLLTIGSLIFFLGYYNPVNKYAYDKGQCQIVENDISEECKVINDCTFYGIITLKYNNGTKPLFGVFTLFSAANYQDAQNIINQKYFIGSSITCYYPKDSHEPLRIHPEDFTREKVARGFGILFFVLSGITFILMMAMVFFLHWGIE